MIDSNLISEETDSPEELVIASKTSRFLAFLLDFSLILTLCLMVCIKVIVPIYYPDASAELVDMLRQAQIQAETGRAATVIDASPRVQEMLQNCNLFILLAMWGFFTLSEFLTAGASLGKRTFSIQVIQESTLQPPSALGSFLRSGLKTLAIMAFFPLLLISFCLIFINKNRKTGHDLLSKTLVIVTPAKDLDHK